MSTQYVKDDTRLSDSPLPPIILIFLFIIAVVLSESIHIGKITNIWASIGVALQKWISTSRGASFEMKMSNRLAGHRWALGHVTGSFTGKQIHTSPLIGFIPQSHMMTEARGWSTSVSSNDCWVSLPSLSKHHSTIKSTCVSSHVPRSQDFKKRSSQRRLKSHQIWKALFHDTHWEDLDSECHVGFFSVVVASPRKWSFFHSSPVEN